VIPLHLLPDTVDYIALGEDLGNGPTEMEPVRVRCRVETKTKLITYAEGRTANATDFVILAPSVTPQLEAKLQGSPLWGAYGERRILSIETLRLIDGQVHHHEVWAG
jgi:hypothetical protein